MHRVPSKEVSPPPGNPSTVNMRRKRKSHTKSRTGCSNCKMRSVKCDETKPSCNNCSVYRVTCSYLASVDRNSQGGPQDLVYPGESSFSAVIGEDAPSDCSIKSPDSGHSSSGDASRLVATPQMPQEVLQQGLPMAPVSENSDQDTFQLQPIHIDILHRFRDKTIATFGNRNTSTWYKDNLTDMIRVHPFLVHMCLATAMIHDAHLSKTPMASSDHAALAFHWYHGAALFKNNLHKATLLRQEDSAKLSPKIGQGFYLASVILSVAAIANVDSESPAHAWPMKQPEPLDLDWLQLTQGQRAVWKIADTFSPGALFERLQDDYGWRDATLGVLRPHGLPKAMYSRLELAGATEKTNPYYTAAAVLSQILHLETHEGNLFYMFNFVMRLEPPYRQLLQQRDPRALLLLGYWYCKMAPFPTWWLRRRCVIEGLAVCEYLRQTHTDDDEMLHLLDYPAARLRAVALNNAEFPGCDTFLKGKPEALYTSCQVN